jgi:hypothetical protein
VRKKKKTLTKTSNSSLKQILRHDEFFNCSEVERNTKGPKEVEEKKNKKGLNFLVYNQHTSSSENFNANLSYAWPTWQLRGLTGLIIWMIFDSFSMYICRKRYVRICFWIISYNRLFSWFCICLFLLYIWTPHFTNWIYCTTTDFYYHRILLTLKAFFKNNLVKLIWFLIKY